MVKRAIINKKIQTITRAIDFLNQYQTISFETFKKDLLLQSALLYQLEKAIQALIDLLLHIVADEGWGVVLNKANLADLLVVNNVITEAFRDKFIRIYGFRNILVHEYEEIDLRVAFQIIQKDKEDLVRILHQVMDFLKV